MHELKDSGLKMAMLTNNVREWEPLWRSMLPVDEIFEEIVDSAFVGCRKPEARIYELTLERIGMPAEECLFIDDLEPNIEGAEAAGMKAVHFRDNEQAIGEIRAALGAGGLGALALDHGAVAAERRRFPPAAGERQAPAVGRDQGADLRSAPRSPAGRA